MLQVSRQQVLVIWSGKPYWLRKRKTVELLHRAWKARWACVAAYMVEKAMCFSASRQHRKSCKFSRRAIRAGVVLMLLVDFPVLPDARPYLAWLSAECCSCALL